ncbi:MAG: hypothetical protein NZZ41_06955 [Candidatus Dojkabacteria bacterium]|nr:hypothetical protein [Candidatus Dojkabacteria bacterium]
MKITLNFKKIVLYSVFGLYGILLLLPVVHDPDTFWHIKLGEEIYTNKPFTNNITFTCENYLWINHSWLGSLIMYLLYSIGNLPLIHIFVGIVLVTGIWINLKNIEIGLKIYNNKSLYEFFIKYKNVFYIFGFIIFLSLLNFFIGARPQIFNFLFVSIIINIILNINIYLNWNKYIFVFFLSVLWINLHGGFIAGIALLFVAICLETFSLGKNVINDSKVEVVKKNLIVIKKYVYVIILMLFGSLFNLFGPKIWEEIFNAIFSIENYIHIIEWRELNLRTPIGYIYLFVFIYTIIISSYTRNFVLTFLNTFAGIIPFFSTRYMLMIMPILVISCIVCTVQLVYTYKEHIIKYIKFLLYEFYTSLVLKNIIIILGNFLLFAILFLKVNSWINNLNNFNNYPLKAIQHIRNNIDNYSKLKFFNDYGWGGFLALYVPEIKWFIDGRMPTWNCNSIIDQKRNILYDYLVLDLILDENKLEEIIQKYDINAAIVKNTSLPSKYLTKINWEVVYKDEISVILLNRNRILKTD